MTSGQRTFFADERRAELLPTEGSPRPTPMRPWSSTRCWRRVDVLVTDDAVTPEQCERLLAVDVTVEVAR
jgi:hypothetical protein